jgi:hypothetical protein
MKAWLGALAAILFLVSCGSQETTEPAAAHASPETFLIESAATDFQQHVAPTGIAFRAVHAGVMSGPDGARLNLICGEYRKSQEDVWTPFATIQTSDYENWLGETTYCSSEGTSLDASRDLAEALTQRYRSTQ